MFFFNPPTALRIPIIRLLRLFRFKICSPQTVPGRTDSLLRSGLRSIRLGFALAVGLAAAVPEVDANVTRVVNSLADPAVPVAGQTTLRDAVAAAASGDTIEFAQNLFTGPAPVTLELTRTLVVSKNLTIVGPGDGAESHTPRLLLAPKPGTVGSFRLLRISPAANSRSVVVVVLAGLAFQGGRDAGGGAVLVESGTEATFQACDFTGNQTTGSSFGGAILNHGTLTLDRCLVNLNVANNGHGGGVASFGKLQVVNSLIGGNRASAFGGGIYSGGSDLLIESATISGNTGGTGGGIAFVAEGRTIRTATITSATVVDNVSAGKTGGLFVEGSAAVANVGGSLFARNAIQNNGGALIPSDFSVERSGKINSANYNIFVKPGTTLSPYGPQDQVGVDPQAGPLAYNGGRTRTHLIGLTSPARDRGNPNFVGVLSLTDQCGTPRVWPLPPGGRVDVGAYEFSASLSFGQALVIEGTGPTTPANLKANLTLPGGGLVTANWSVMSVPAASSQVSIPAAPQPQELTFSGSFAFGTTPVTLNVTSGSLSLTRSTTVTVRDATPPVLSLPPDQILEATGPAGAVAVFGASASDAVDGSVPVTFSAASGSTFAVGTTVVTATARDAAGNTSNGWFTIIVRDTTKPVIVPQANLVVEATGPGGAAATFAPTATDTVSTPTVIASPVSGSTFPLGTTTVTVTAKDGASNTATSVFTVTVRDTTPPTVTPPANVVAEATGAAGATVSYPAAVATDAVGVASLLYSQAPGSVFPLGTTTVSVTASDGAGNAAATTFTVTVRDTTAPLIAALPNLNVSASVAGGAVVTFAPTATDAVSTPTLTAVPASGSTFPVGTTTVTVTAKDAAGNTATRSFTVTVEDPFGVTINNVTWPFATDFIPKLAGAPGEKQTGSIRQMLARAGESRWFKFEAKPGSKIEIALSDLPANFDVVVYSDIRKVYDELLGLTAPGSSTIDQRLALLGAEFAPEAYSPEAYSPEAYSPEAYSPEAYSPEAYSPEAYSPEAYSPEAYSPEAYSPEAYSPEAYSPEAYSPEAYSPEAYSPEAYASAQQRSVVAFSARAATATESVRLNTYSKSGIFYIRVRGQNGVFSLDAPFKLSLAVQNDLCSGVTDLNTVPASGAPLITGSPTSLIVWDSTRIAGTPAERSALAASLGRLATAVSGVLLDVSGDQQIARLNAQADANPDCPSAKNLVFEAIRNLIQLYRKAAPTIADITLVGNDAVIPFFRSDDQALLASEANYFPPVRDGTQSQSSLRYAQVLSQDRYGSARQVFLGTGPYDLPEIPVGRLVETAAEVQAYVDTYLPLFNNAASSGTVPTPRSAFVAGYDFLADSAEAMKTELTGGLGAGGNVNSLISPFESAPALGWTAGQWRAAFLGSRHDISYLAGHFSTGRALAADFTTRFRAKEVADSALNLAFALVMSPGCHSGYSTVDQDAITGLTDQPDWAQAFARKKAILIGGTGYQYGDTDFIEYTERLLLEVTRSLRSGTGPVSIGQAMVDAKRRYLTDTPIMRGIHEKTLLQLTLYGLPMVKFNLPGRVASPVAGGDVAAVLPVVGGPGVALNLKQAELSFNPVLTREDRTLDVVGSTSTVTASFFRGSDGFVSIVGEPVRALEKFNVSRPEGLVRGIGFRGGLYRDLAGFLPFTGAPATETRGVHGGFLSEVLYPIRPWSLNQVGEFAAAGGNSTLNVFPTQFMSDGPNSPTGNLRAFDQMQFTVFYSPETSTSALANPPAINVVASEVNAGGVAFSVDVAAAAGAGVQEVWVTYTGLAGSPFYGNWRSLTLTRPSAATGIGRWTGTLALPAGSDAGSIRFMVQAVNGVGGVAQSTNFGRFFVPGASTLDAVGAVGAPTTLTFLGTIPASGFYRASQPLQAKLTDGAGLPLAGKRIQFRLGSLTKSAMTDAGGVASTTLVLGARPSDYALEAGFAGDAGLRNSSVTRSFAITKIPTRLTFESGALVANASGIVVSLRANDGTPLKERSVLVILTKGSTTTVLSEISDVAGQVRLSPSAVGPGTYQVAANFGRSVNLPDGTVASLNDPLYDGSTASMSVTVGAALVFSDVAAFVNYDDLTAPGATPGNAGASQAGIRRGTLSLVGSSFDPNSLLSSGSATTLTALVRATLSGKTLVDGSVVLRVYSNDNKHWRGTAVINGATVDLSVDWDNDLNGAARCSALITPARGGGPLYNVVPALLHFELTLGVGVAENPAGGATDIGGAENPWIRQSGGLRIR